MTTINDIAGVEGEKADALRQMGIETMEKLLETGGTPKGRQEIAAKTGLDADEILDWVNRADLSRIRGVRREYADLLEVSGVDTVRELAQRNPQNLFESLQAVNEEQELVQRMPTREQVNDWVDQAKALSPKVTY
jgi:predicted RecB family nuclease